MEKISSYGKPLNYGHRYLSGLNQEPCVVQEKIDGSQFSFAKMDGRLVCRSRSAQIDLEMPQALVGPTVRHLQSVVDRIPEGIVFRGEAMCKPRHNCLTYERVPRGHLVLFDVEAPRLQALTIHGHKVVIERWAEVLEVEPVAHLGTLQPGFVLDEAWLNSHLEKPSQLGGKREGVVVKNYQRLGPDSKPMMAKLVSQDFKEANKQLWRGIKNPQAGVMEKLEAVYRTEARWNKAVQHLCEAGELEMVPQDIPKLLKEVNQDLLAEEQEAIKQMLFDHYWKPLSRAVTRGLPEWWKARLMEEVAA